MGYTYETTNNVASWVLNEKSMYRGVAYAEKKVIKIDDKNWAYTTHGSRNGFTWSFEGEWAVTSFEKCRRAYLVDFK